MRSCGRHGNSPRKSNPGLWTNGLAIAPHPLGPIADSDRSAVNVNAGEAALVTVSLLGRTLDLGQRWIHNL